MIIFVNATAASEIGGLKTIVDQFIKNLDSYDSQNKYFIFVNPNYQGISIPENCTLVKIEAKSYLNRLYWDWFGLRKWSKNNEIKPDLIISLQNTGVLFKREIRQIIYLHTPIPFVKYTWNFFRKNERALWFYKYIYPTIIGLTINKKTSIIVQSKWLKENVSERFGIPKEHIHINMPSISVSDSNNIQYSGNQIQTNNNLIYFYPAADYEYKNHKVIIDSLRLLKQSNIEIYKKTKILFTLGEDSIVYKRAKMSGVLDRVSFLGKLNRDEINNVYISSKAVIFPSYIETFGLPLIEAASFGKQIYCSDEIYAKEVIGNYNGVKFIDPFSPEEWKKVYMDDFNRYKPFTKNTEYESWDVLFRRIINEN